MQRTTERGTAIIVWISWIIALVVTLSFPSIYFAISYGYQVAALEAEVEINSLIVTRLINLNPLLWRYEEVRLSDVLERQPQRGGKELRVIVDNSGAVVFAGRETLDSPILTLSEELFDSGKSVGKISISRSLRPLLAQTGVVALLGLTLGFAILFGIRLFPLRALRRALDSLYTEKEQLAVTLQSIGDGVITTDSHGRVVLMNGQAEILTGYTQREALNRPITEVFRTNLEITGAPGEDCVEKALLLGEKVEFTEDTVLVAKGGTERIISESASPIRDQQNRITGVVLAFRDITEKHKMQSELLKAQKIESIGVLAGSIAHDFNNILTAIVGNITMVKAWINPNDRIHDRLTKVEQSALRAEGLTRQLLTFSKGGAPRKTTFAIERLLKDSISLVLRESSIACEYDLPDDLWPVEADETQLSQVINNLAINAQQAMPNGGKIFFSCRNMDLGAEGSPALNPGRYVKISVEDQGVGIPKADIEKIFDPYYSTKERGLGLGLTSTYSILKKHGGHIEVASEIGAGTTFHLYIPAGHEMIVARNEEQRTPSFGKGRILIMDDEEIILDVLEAMLTNFGYEVACAKHGAEAIEIYKIALGAGCPFQAVIMDLTIPGGMGGKDAIEKLLEIDPDAKAIVSSGYSIDPVMANYKNFGFKGVVAKPYKASEMGTVLRDVIKE